MSDGIELPKGLSDILDDAEEKWLESLEPREVTPDIPPDIFDDFPPELDDLLAQLSDLELKLWAEGHLDNGLTREFKRLFDIWFDSKAASKKKTWSEIRMKDLLNRGEISERLTKTEITVARLMADGLDNSEIAKQLCISKYTAETHVTHIYSKLHFENGKNDKRQREKAIIKIKRFHFDAFKVD